MQTPAAAASAAAAAGLGRAGYPFTPLCPSKPSHQRKTFTIDSLLSASATSPSPSFQSQGLACCPAAGCVLGATLAVPALARAPAAVYPSLLYPRAAHPVYYGAPFLYRPATDACTLTRCPHDYPLAKSPFPTRQRPGKAKRARTIFTHEQLARLEKEFAHQQYMVGSERFLLASTLQLNESQVKVWFQNRRIKWRKQSLEQQQANLARLGMAETLPRPDSPGARDGSGSPRERRADPHPLAPPAGSGH